MCLSSLTHILILYTVTNFPLGNDILLDELTTPSLQGYASLVPVCTWLSGEATNQKNPNLAGYCVFKM